MKWLGRQEVRRRIKKAIDPALWKVFHPEGGPQKGPEYGTTRSIVATQVGVHDQRFSRLVVVLEG